MLVVRRAVKSSTLGAWTDHAVPCPYCKFGVLNSASVLLASMPCLKTAVMLK